MPTRAWNLRLGGRDGAGRSRRIAEWAASRPKKSSAQRTARGRRPCAPLRAAGARPARALPSMPERAAAEDLTAVSKPSGEARPCKRRTSSRCGGRTWLSQLPQPARRYARAAPGDPARPDRLAGSQARSPTGRPRARAGHGARGGGGRYPRASGLLRQARRYISSIARAFHTTAALRSWPPDERSRQHARRPPDRLRRGRGGLGAANPNRALGRICALAVLTRGNCPWWPSHTLRGFRRRGVEPSHVRGMLATLLSAVLVGLDARLVHVEVDVSPGSDIHRRRAPTRSCAGRDRSHASGTRVRIPWRHITINLAPADVRKEGAAYDLPIALGILAATEARRAGMTLCVDRCRSTGPCPTGGIRRSRWRRRRPRGDGSSSKRGQRLRSPGLACGPWPPARRDVARIGSGKNGATGPPRGGSEPRRTRLRGGQGQPVAGRSSKRPGPPCPADRASGSQDHDGAPAGHPAPLARSLEVTDPLGCRPAPGGRA